MRSLARRAGPGAALLLTFLALSVLLKLGVWTSPLTRISGTFGAAGWNDPYNAVWYLAWTPYALSHGMSPFTTTYLNFPTGVNLAWNTFMPALGILLWPVTALGGALLSDNVITTLAPAVGGLLAYLAIRRYVGSRLWAAVGALLYAFSPFMMAQDPYHAQNVSAAALIPLILILVDEAVVRQRMRPWVLGLLAALAATFEYYILEEYVITELLAAAIVVAILALSRPREVARRWRYLAVTAGVAAPLTALAIAYPVLLQLAGPNPPVGLLHDPTAEVTDLANLVVPTATQAIAPSWAVAFSSNQWTGNLGEWAGYVGAGLLVVATLTVVLCWRNLVVRVAGVFSLCMAVLSLGPYLHVGGTQTAIPLPFWLLYQVPLVQEVIAGRLMVYAFLGLAVLLAVALSRLWRRRLRLLWVPLVAAVALVPLIPAPLPAEGFSQPPGLAAAVAGIPPGTVVYSVPSVWPPTYSDDVRYQDAVAWQVESGMRFRLVGGYFFGQPAPGQVELLQLGATLAGPDPFPPLSSAERSLLLGELTQSHVGAVVLAAVADPAAATAAMTAILGFPPTVTGEVAVWLLPPAG